jgi:hypothetical protein
MYVLRNFASSDHQKLIRTMLSRKIRVAYITTNNASKYMLDAQFSNSY